ncbi:hypothetical protein BpHYR1_012679 [Brachionus plicatilis]|uniref:Uncharacterized protein n=1 Tax=Brachionus plicatilis TaxID=10195 RepID=A0A3M7Q6W8_BRAPC|nr:hypothetical protein BpHYR1_012679 [Brachionus plicatilis]
MNFEKYHNEKFGLNILVLKFKVAKSPCDSINKICTNIYQAGNIFYLISCSYSTEEKNDKK